MRSAPLVLLTLALVAMPLASFGCNDVLGITELAATDAGTPATTSTSTNNDGGTSTVPKIGLLDLTTSFGPVEPAFDQDTYLYTTRPTLSVLGDIPFTVTPTTSAGTTVVIANGTVGSGFPSNPISRGGIVPNLVQITVTPPNQPVRKYALLMPALQGAYVKASNTAQQAQFGASVAVSKDGNTMAIGAEGESSFAKGIDGNQSDTTTPGAGAVYIFKRSSLDWKQEAYIKASNTRTNLAFGNAVALSDNGDTLLVGASGEASSTRGVGGNQADTSAANAGAVYVFARSGTTWSQDAYVKPSNTRASSYFGRALTISGDGASFAVGAFGESSGVASNQNDTSASNAGAVYTFVRQSGTWIQQSYLKASNIKSASQFGFALSMSGDGNTLAVGAYGESGGSSGINGNQNDFSKSGSGATYVFVRNGSAWTQQAYVKASNSRTNAIFGYCVALSTSGDTMVVGAYGESSGSKGVNGNQNDTTQSYSGASYIFSRNAGSWTQEAYLKASNTRSSGYFGGAVGITGDGATVGIGSFGESSLAMGVNGILGTADQNDQSAPEAGSAYVFTKKNGQWAQKTYVKASNTQEQGQFGSALAMSGDGTVMAIGAYGEPSKSTGVNGDQGDFSMPNAGAVYLFP